MWEAPCSAWLDYGFTDSCTDPNETMSLFSSGFDAPYGPFPPNYTEQNESGLSEEELAERRGIEEEIFLPEIVADASGSAPTGGSPLPDVAGAVAGDDGSGPLPLGSVTTLPESVQLDFLFEFCWGPCFRDAHFMDPDNPGVGSGVFTSDTPFHVRHGFLNNSGEPLGDGFDVVIYATALDEPGEFGGQPTGVTYRYTSDYVLQGTADECGPTYGAQAGPETCEWFVHEFNNGLPEGRHALWVMWEAPCSAWLDYGFTDSCTDPNETMSLFSSGFDAPYGPFPPNYTEQNESP
jgi:hypothetical protein